MTNKSLSEEDEQKKIAHLIHTGRTSLSVVLGFLEDLQAGMALTGRDTVDAIQSGRKIKEIFELLSKCLNRERAGD